MKKSKITLIGAGRAGTAFTLAMNKAGYSVAGVSSKSLSSAMKAANLLQCDHYSTDNCAFIVESDIIVIATPDREILPVSENLAASGLCGKGQLYIHLSGAVSSDALLPIGQSGSAICSVHPMQALLEPHKAAMDLAGSWFCLEGSPDGILLANSMVDTLSGKRVEISKQHKAKYHAALCISSNFLVSLQGLAVQLLEDVGFERQQSLDALLPLIHGAVSNLTEAGLPAALTGPIRRGDTQTVVSHLNALSSVADIQAVYRVLAMQTVRLTQQLGELDDDNIDQLEACLSLPSLKM